MQQRSKTLIYRPVFKATVGTTYSIEYVTPDIVVYFPCSRLPTIAARGIERWNVWTSERSEVDSSAAPTAHGHVRVGCRISVEFNASWEERVFAGLLDSMPDWYLAVETSVLTPMSKAVKHVKKHLSSVKSPSRPRCTGPPSTLGNAALNVRTVDVMQDLYLGDVIVLLRPTEL